ncbi:MAG: hypothetical protein AABW71_03640 [Nanoarchaeota archaeon]
MGKRMESLKENTLGVLALASLTGEFLAFLVKQPYRVLRSNISRRVAGSPEDGLKRYVGGRSPITATVREAVLSAEGVDYLVEPRLIKSHIFTRPSLNIVGQVVNKGRVYDCSHYISDDGKDERSGLGYEVRDFYDYTPIKAEDFERARKDMVVKCKPEIERIFRERFNRDSKITD